MAAILRRARQLAYAKELWTMGRVVIACYRPKPGREAELKRLMRTHVERLREQDLATDRTPILVQAVDGTFVEVFEWNSQQAMDDAHSNPVVLEMWAEYEAVCDYVPIGQVPEAAELFSSFDPVAFDD
jgi:quinol monooxygenase YgiN